MKVTDEMVDVAMLALGVEWPDQVRAAVEAVLADVPEPADIVAACDKACRYSEGLAQAAEAKLEKVRAWRKHYALTAEAGDELDAILYGEDP